MPLKGLEIGIESVYDRGQLHHRKGARDGKVRKIGSRNPQTSMFGVHPGDTVASARGMIRNAGFSETGEPGRFRKGDLVLTILANGPDTLFGLVLESTD